jgi:hypothetical protein
MFRDDPAFIDDVFLLAQIYGNIGLRYPQRDSIKHPGKLA